MPLIFTYIMGCSLKLISMTLGACVKSFGKSDLALSTASFTFCKATSVGTLVPNSMVIAEKSCCELEVNFVIFAPVIPLICFSIGPVTRFSISLGELPTYTVCTNMVGIIISGNCSFGSVKNWNIPPRLINSISRYIEVLLVILQEVGLNSLNFSFIF